MESSSLPPPLSRSRTSDREEGKRGSGTARQRPQSVHYGGGGGGGGGGVASLEDFRSDDGRDHQNWVSSVEYRYILGRKDMYKEECGRLNSENRELRHHLDQVADNQSRQDGRNAAKGDSRSQPSVVQLSQKQNKILHDHFEAALHLVKTFGLKDVFQAESEWSKDLNRLRETEDQLKRLQQEVLTAVDRFDPNADAKAVEAFKLLNGAIGKLSKAKDLNKLVLNDPLSEWDASVLWNDSVAPTVAKGTLKDREKKLLLRQAIWKFLSARLFDRSRPFASYGGLVGELAASLAYDKLFPDHSEFLITHDISLLSDLFLTLCFDSGTNKNAGKWRSVTVHQLNEHSESDQDKKDFRVKIARDFAAFIQNHLLPPTGKVTLEEVERVATEKGDFSKRLDDVLNQAINLSRLLMGERAAFALVSPSLKDIKYFKQEEDDDFTTALGHNVGIADGADVESDQTGKIRMMVSPMLIKYGDAGGENLHQETVVVRAFVTMEE